MNIEHELAPQPPLKIVTDEMAEQAAFEVDAENVAIARRLVDNPKNGITRVMVVGLSGTYVIEPTPSAAQCGVNRATSESEITVSPVGWLDMLRRRLWKKANS